MLATVQHPGGRMSIIVSTMCVIYSNPAGMCAYMYTIAQHHSFLDNVELQQKQTNHDTINCYQTEGWANSLAFLGTMVIF